MKRLAASMVVVVALLVGLGIPPAGAATLSGYKVTNYDNDGTHGVYLRNSATASDKTTKELLYGTTVTLVCYVPNGTSEGPGNKMWDKVSVTSGTWKGSTGYLSEHWLNTPVKANQHVAGEPQCGSTSTTSTAAAKAIAWANAQLGSTSWNQKCLSFVRNAYSNAGVNLYNEVNVPWGANTFPQDIWGHFTAGRTGTGTPPAGALVFYLAKSDKSNSHVTIAIDGSSNTISTNDTFNNTAVHRESITQHSNSGAYNTYKGWWLP